MKESYLDKNHSDHLNGGLRNEDVSIRQVVEPTKISICRVNFYSIIYFALTFMMTCAQLAASPFSLSQQTDHIPPVEKPGITKESQPKASR
jgi:hypothetical protein